MRGGTPAQGLWMPPRVATLFVAASDALDKCRAQADYICDGVADDVQINAAMAALPAAGGRVVLSEGTFVLAESIVFPDDNIVLEGQGWCTGIIATALATGDHAIQMIGKVFCCVKNLAILGSAGTGNTVHCIFIDDGSDMFIIDGVYIAASDADGIHVEGTVTQYGVIKGCYINATDGYGIYISMDAANTSLSFKIHDNHIESAGGAGIYFGQCNGHYYHEINDNLIISCDYGVDYGVATVPTFGLMEASIINNTIIDATNDGIRLLSDSDNNFIENNYINGCGGYGINIGGPTCGQNRLMNNILIGNVSGAAQDLGVGTQLPFIFIPVPNPSTNIGAHPAEQLTDDLEVVSRFNLYIPLGFQELITCDVIIVPGGTGNMRRSVVTNWGELASGETYNAAVDGIAAGEVAVTTDWMMAIDISDALLGAPPALPGDVVGVAFTRHGDHANDTVGANCYLIGLRLRYV